MEIKFKRKNGFIEFISPRTGKKDWIIASLDIFKMTTTIGGLLLHKKDEKRNWTTKCII